MRLADKLAEMNGSSGEGLSVLYRMGVVTLATLTNYELWLLYEATRTLPAFVDCPHRVVTHIANQCGIHRTTVRRAVNLMNTPV